VTKLKSIYKNDGFKWKKATNWKNSVANRSKDHFWYVFNKEIENPFEKNVYFYGYIFLVV